MRLKEEANIRQKKEEEEYYHKREEAERLRRENKGEDKDKEENIFDNKDLTADQKLMKLYLSNQKAILKLRRNMEKLLPKKDCVGTTPDKFKGKKEDAPRFWTQVIIYLHNNQHIYSDKVQKISFLFGLCTEVAGEWAQPYCKMMQEERLPWKTWEEFERELKLTWYHSDRRQAARTKIAALRQGGDSISSYTINFQLVTNQCDFSESDLTWRYLQGLSPTFQEILMKWQGPLDTIDQVKAAALQIESCLGLFNKEKPIPSSVPHQYRDNKKNIVSQKMSYAPAPRHNENAMEADAGVTVCYNCYQEGHMAKECKFPKEPFRCVHRKGEGSRKFHQTARASNIKEDEETPTPEFEQSSSKGKEKANDNEKTNHDEMCNLMEQMRIAMARFANQSF